MTALTTREVRCRLQRRYGTTTQGIGVPEHLVVFEVPIDGRERYRGREFPGYHARQRIDAVAVGLWRRTGHLIHGFEIKVSRRDLLAELREPDKAAAGVAVCDRWWLVLGDATLLRDADNIPDGWGVLVPHGHGLRTLVNAAPRQPDREPRFVAGIVQATLLGRGSYARALGYRDGYARGYAHGRGRR